MRIFFEGFPAAAFLPEEAPVKPLGAHYAEIAGVTAMATNARFPDLSQLSVAILEHSVEPLLGEKAIKILRSPNEEMELKKSLAAVLKKTEGRFADEFQDSVICRAILDIPPVARPALQDALRLFYSSPTDKTFSGILQRQVGEACPDLPANRISEAISAYIKILREELVPLSNEIRDKLSAYALLGIADGVNRIVAATESIQAAIYNPGAVRISDAPAAPKRKGKEPKRELLYRVAPSGSIDTIGNEWEFLSSSVCAITISGGIIDIDGVGVQTCCFPQIDSIGNCSVECEIRIVATNNNDASHWAGLRLRGFIYDFNFGYLAYLRKKGTIELYRAYEVIAGASEMMVPTDTMGVWTKIRVDVFGSRIRVWVGGNLHIDVMDKKFSDRGLVYLHTYHAHAQFRNLQIFKLKA